MLHYNFVRLTKLLFMWDNVNAVKVLLSLGVKVHDPGYMQPGHSIAQSTSVE